MAEVGNAGAKSGTTTDWPGMWIIWERWDGIPHCGVCLRGRLPTRAAIAYLRKWKPSFPQQKERNLLNGLLAAGLVFLVGMILSKILKPKNSTWSVSENGNETIVRDGLRVTVFRRNGGWAYACAPVEREEAEFWGDYDSKSEAKRAAAFNEFGEGRQVETIQEKRAEINRKKHTSQDYRNEVRDDLEKLREILAASSAKVDSIVAVTSRPPRVKTLKQKLRSETNSAHRLVLRSIDAELEREEKEAFKLHEAFLDLTEKLERHQDQF